MQIILDTNFLIYCAKEKFDYIEELSNILNENYELVVPEQVVEEMKKLKGDKMKKVSRKDKMAADLALQILEKNKIKKVKAEGYNVDEAIVNLSKENKKNIVCTLDREIRWELGRVILISKGKKLMLTR